MLGCVSSLLIETDVFGRDGVISFAHSLYTLFLLRYVHLINYAIKAYNLITPHIAEQLMTFQASADAQIFKVRKYYSIFKKTFDFHLLMLYNPGQQW
jgi:hypothetical protein